MFLKRTVATSFQVLSCPQGVSPRRAELSFDMILKKDSLGSAERV